MCITTRPGATGNKKQLEQVCAFDAAAENARTLGCSQGEKSQIRQPLLTRNEPDGRRALMGMVLKISLGVESIFQGCRAAGQVEVGLVRLMQN